MINYIQTSEIEKFIAAQNLATNGGFTKTKHKFTSFLQQEWTKNNKSVNLDLTEGRLIIAIAIVEDEKVIKGWKILNNLWELRNFCDQFRDDEEKQNYKDPFEK